MALVYADRVKETTTTTGTGTITLAGAAAQFQSFAAVGNGNTCDYCLLSGNGTDWETGLGTYTLSGTTLARTTVYASSNSGSHISLTGTSTVFLTLPAARLPVGDVLYSDFVDQGNWNGSTSYALGSVVTDSSKRYLCKVAVGSSGSGTPGWNATYGSTHFTVSGTNNNTANWLSNIGTAMIVALQGIGVGKIYFEIQPPNMGVYGGTISGFANSGHSNTTNLGANTDSVGLDDTSGGLLWHFNGSTSASGMSRMSSGHWFGFAVDIDNALVWVRDATGAPSTWFGNNGASPNPATGTNGFSFSGIGSPTIFPASGDNQSDGAFSIVLNIGDTSFVASAPSGFTDLYTAGGLNSAPSVDTTSWISLSP